MPGDRTSFLPLSPAIQNILRALAGEERHGYGIMQEVARQSEGKYRLGPGTLYDNLEKLMGMGLVEELTSPPAGKDSRRKYYRISGLGWQVLAAEIARLEVLIREVKPRLRSWNLENES
jgi:DNA-binding PadR family transcriptional regulator